MATSSAQKLDECLLALCWGQWTELGVRGADDGSDAWSIDPEPLIALTSMLAEVDPRLRDESLDWCMQNRRYISLGRLRHLTRLLPDRVRPNANRYITFLTARGHAVHEGPGAEGWSVRLSGKSHLADLKRPGMMRIRMRAIIGVGTRTEILHVLGWDSPGWYSAAELAELIGSTKRAAIEALDGLERAGVLTSTTSGNRKSFSMPRRSILEGLPGEMPPRFINWLLVTRAVADVRNLLIEYESSPSQVREIQAALLINSLSDRYGQNELPTLPLKGHERERCTSLEGWTLSLLSDLTRGRDPLPTA